MEHQQTSKTAWLLTFSIALFACLVLCGSVEYHRRAQGHFPSVRDDLDLWALERARVRAAGADAIAILGTSRILYALDPDVLAAKIPGKVPVMLAVNGAYPLAALSDLARDQNFSGSAFVDIDGRGLSRYYRDMQQAQVRHFAEGVGPSAALHRRLLSQWQAHLLLADPEIGLLPTVTRLFFGAPRPNLRFVRISPNRAGAADYQHPAANASAMAANFAAGVRSDHQLRPPPPRELWLAELSEVSRDIRAIRARGGRVMFFCSPTSGAHLAADQQGYPRADYWDRFVREIAEPNGAHAIYGLDVPAIAALNLPDGSHLDMRDRAAFTAAVAQLLTDANAR